MIHTFASPPLNGRLSRWCGYAARVRRATRFTVHGLARGALDDAQWPPCGMANIIITSELRIPARRLTRMQFTSNYDATSVLPLNTCIYRSSHYGTIVDNLVP